MRIASARLCRSNSEPLPGALLHDHAPDKHTFLNDVLSGLSQPEKTLPCKYFYDEHGSLLFDRICETEEYYPTRTELSIMYGSLPEMAEALGPETLLVEYGSGTSLKTRLLLDELSQPAGYVPIDICREHLIAASEQLCTLFPELPVLPVCGDYMSSLSLPESPLKTRRKVVYFPGSTIGNFYPSQAAAFLERAAELCGAGGGMLIGLDLRKDENVLNAAYNDGKGLTAQFNLNLLQRINRELGGNFDLSQFEHAAFFNDFRGRIEMHLVSKKPQKVTVDGEVFTFQTGESIHTECSYKYDLAGFKSLAAYAGWTVVQTWTDPESWFAIVYMTTT